MSVHSPAHSCCFLFALIWRVNENLINLNLMLQAPMRERESVHIKSNKVTPSGSEHPFFGSAVVRPKCERTQRILDAQLSCHYSVERKMVSSLASALCWLLPLLLLLLFMSRNFHLIFCRVPFSSLNFWATQKFAEPNFGSFGHS